ncbi:hypothetical protein [Arenibaculum sp.]|uniref:hypothetical protein n=1 Tax=Arenibaculum sp. TaxID=2865862 RepID=UPI002E1267E6|nr:hypothetical protein [Arenibaculum sp.]
MRIAAPAETAYETAPQDARDLIDQMVETLNAVPEWPARSALLLEMIDALDIAMTADGIEDDEDEGEEDEDGDEAGYADDDFAEMMTFYVGAVLERLGEAEMHEPEQAAFYMLSCHPEHLDAAQGWLGTPGNAEAFESFVDANPDYAAVLDMIEDLYLDPDEIDE